MMARSGGGAACSRSSSSARRRSSSASNRPELSRTACCSEWIFSRAATAVSGSRKRASSSAFGGSLDSVSSPTSRSPACVRTSRASSATIWSLPVPSRYGRAARRSPSTSPT